MDYISYTTSQYFRYLYVEGLVLVEEWCRVGDRFEVVLRVHSKRVAGGDTVLEDWVSPSRYSGILTLNNLFRFLFSHKSVLLQSLCIPGPADKRLTGNGGKPNTSLAEPVAAFSCEAFICRTW